MFEKFRAKKGCVGCLSVLALFMLIIPIVFFATSGVVGVADDFLEHLSQKRLDQAYSLLGPSLTSEMPREDFDDFLVESQLEHAVSGSWSNRSVENNSHGQVGGKVTLNTGKSISVKISLEKSNDNWLIQGIKVDP